MFDKRIKVINGCIYYLLSNLLNYSGFFLHFDISCLVKNSYLTIYNLQRAFRILLNVQCCYSSNYCSKIIQIY